MVFRNILKNAVQHNDTETTKIRVAVNSDADYLHVRIADNGPGVRDELKEEIFRKDERGLESAGTGIGLYSVRTLLEGHDRAVWVEDNEPSGAELVIERHRAG